MTKVVTCFHMHETAFIKAFGKKLDKTVSDNLHKGIEMELIGPGVLCKLNGKQFIVPLVNCKVIELADEPEKEKPKDEKVPS